MKITQDKNAKISFWKRYYYRYLGSILNFIVPKNVNIWNVDQAEGAIIKFDDKVFHDYIVVSDILGYVNDVDGALNIFKDKIKDDGRIVITQYNALWEPLLRLASVIGLRKNELEKNWLSKLDLNNFAYLAGLEVVKSGTKMLMPFYIPLISEFLNVFLANIWPFSKLGLFHYLVLRKVVDKTKNNPSLSIIVAARNEAGTIERIARELPEVGKYTEIIFIEGNSKDNTYEEIERVCKIKFGNKILKYAKQDGKGKGDAVRKGFEMATGEILTIYDADMTVPADEMVKFYEAIVKDKGEFINGSRLVYPMEKQSMRALNFLGNKFFSFAFSSILGQPIKDTLCGTKVIWRKDYEKVKKGREFFGDFDPFGDFDLLFGASKLNLKIIDLPVHYKDRVYGATNISRWKHGWLLLKMTVFASRKIKFL